MLNKKTTASVVKSMTKIVDDLGEIHKREDERVSKLGQELEEAMTERDEANMLMNNFNKLLGRD